MANELILICSLSEQSCSQSEDLALLRMDEIKIRSLSLGILWFNKYVLYVLGLSEEILLEVGSVQFLHLQLVAITVGYQVKGHWGVINMEVPRKAMRRGQAATCESLELHDPAREAATCG